MNRVWHHIVRLVVLSAMLVMHGNTVWADEPSPRKPHLPCDSSLDAGSIQGRLQGLQIETNDIAAYERFFSDVLHASVVQHIDHPQIDMLRGYCYRDVLIVVRQDVRSPRPTGWIQINFSVSDVAAVQRELEQALQESGLEQKSEDERKKPCGFDSSLMWRGILSGVETRSRRSRRIYARIRSIQCSKLPSQRPTDAGTTKKPIIHHTFKKEDDHETECKKSIRRDRHEYHPRTGDGGSDRQSR